MEEQMHMIVLSTLTASGGIGRATPVLGRGSASRQNQSSVVHQGHCTQD